MGTLKEEPKQETLGEVAKRLASTTDEYNMFIAGAKWQQEQDKNKYNELVYLLERLRPIYREDSDSYQKYEEKRVEIIEQLKNK
jgi:hypothetical protein